MTETNAGLLVMTVTVLLPLAVVVPLYKLFSANAATAEGPLSGLTVKLGGPIAAYVVIFLLCMFYLRPTDQGHYHTFTVLGTMKFQHPATEVDPNINDVLVRFVPPRLGLLNGGSFAWEIPVMEDSAGHLSFPDLQLDLRDYAGVTIPLSADRSYGTSGLVPKYDMKNRTITLGAPIVMQALMSGHPYRPTTVAQEVK